MNGPADHTVLIGTASKGIIVRDQQHNAQVYRHLYSPNPFSNQTDEDMQKYLKSLKSNSTSALERIGISSTNNKTLGKNFKRIELKKLNSVT